MRRDRGRLDVEVRGKVRMRVRVEGGGEEERGHEEGGETFPA